MSSYKGTLAQEDKSVLGLPEDTKVNSLVGLIEWTPEGKAYLQEFTGELGPDTRRISPVWRTPWVTLDKVKERNAKIIEFRQFGFRHETVMNLVNQMNEGNAKMPPKHWGRLTSIAHIKKIIADHYNMERPSAKDEAYYDYAERIELLKSYERNIEQFEKYKNELIAIAFDEDPKTGVKRPKIDPLKIVVMFEKLGKLKEYLANANNWNFSMRSQFNERATNTINIFSRVNVDESGDHLKSIATDYRARIKAMREARDNGGMEVIKEVPAEVLEN